MIRNLLRTVFASLFMFMGLTISVKADITPQLIQEWNRQPSNVQWDVFYKSTSFNVVDELPWHSPDLSDTWAYTSKYADNGVVSHIDIVVKRGYEDTLTHEVGHVLGDYQHFLNWWIYRPEFITIWQTEKTRCPLLYQGLNDVREYFACAYDAYLRYPKILKNACPSTYNYIKLVLQYT